MRIRSIKPEFWSSASVARLSKELRLLWIGLWSYVDDHGVGLADERLIAAQLFPFSDDPIGEREFVREGLATLSREGRVRSYTVGEHSYIHITGWSEHQKIDRPSKSRHPGPEQADSPPPEPVSAGRGDPMTSPRETLAKDSRALAQDSRPDLGNKGTREQGAGNEGERPRKRGSAPPRATRLPEDFEVTPDLVAWAKAECPDVDGRLETDKFRDYWRAKSGQAATKTDWPATWRNWMRRAQESPPSKSRGRSSATNSPLPRTDAAVLRQKAFRDELLARRNSRENVIDMPSLELQSGEIA